MPVASLRNFLTERSESPRLQQQATTQPSPASLSRSMSCGIYSSSVLSHNKGPQLEIAVIESTMMLQDYDLKKKKRVRRVLTVFNVIIEDQHVHRSLVRYVPDFIEFNRKVKKYYRKSGISLPRLVEPDLRLYSTGKKAAFRAFLNRLSRSRSAKPNSEKIELYLRRCALDPTIGSSSLFRDFLTRQRPEDKELPRLSPPELAENVHHSPCLRESLVETPASSSSVSQSPSGDQVQPHDRLLHHSNAARRQSMSIITYRSSDATEDFSMNRHQPSIDDYRFIQVLGRGCMGKVLLVQPYRLPSRLLALKAISKETVIEQREIVHTRMERDILTEIAKIRHPFLIKLHCAFQNTEQLFLLLDYHRGGDIATQLARHRTFSPRRSRLYAAEILMGLQELHRLGIIYRDLKPENILLASDGHIVLTDFGLSKQFEPHTNMDDQRTSTFCGTAEYLAPEILRQQPYTYAIDFWSLGMILYEMLEGITPFFSDSHSEMYRRILEDDLEFTDAFDDVTRYFIGGLLQRNPSERLGSGLEGPRTIRAHPYFLGLDWSDVYHKRIHPEYVPQLRSEADLSNFDKDFLDMTPRLSPVSNADLSSSALMDIFQGYSYINDSAISSIGSSAGNGSDNHQRRYFYYSDSDIQPDDYRRDSFDQGYPAGSISSVYYSQIYI